MGPRARPASHRPNPSGRTASLSLAQEPCQLRLFLQARKSAASWRPVITCVAERKRRVVTARNARLNLPAQRPATECAVAHAAASFCEQNRLKRSTCHTKVGGSGASSSGAASRARVRWALNERVSTGSSSSARPERRARRRRRRAPGGWLGPAAGCRFSSAAGGRDTGRRARPRWPRSCPAGPRAERTGPAEEGQGQVQVRRRHLASGQWPAIAPPADPLGEGGGQGRAKNRRRAIGHGRLRVFLDSLHAAFLGCACADLNSNLRGARQQPKYR